MIFLLVEIISYDIFYQVMRWPSKVKNVVKSLQD